MTKTLTALTALAFAAAFAGGAVAQTNTGGAMANDKMATDHMMKKDAGMAKPDGAMKSDAMKSDGAMKKSKKKGKKPMAEGAMASDAMPAKK